MEERIENVVTDLSKVAAEVQASFGGFTPEQLNWKPSEKSWSVAQCLDHVIVTHSLMFPILEKLASRLIQSTFWEKYSPLTGYFGRFLIKGLDPLNRKPMKTTSNAYPSLSRIDGQIVDRFTKHQEEMIEHIRRLPLDLDPRQTIITSPLMAFVTYTLEDWFTILTHHCWRHFGQAVRVTEAPGFPVTS